MRYEHFVLCNIYIFFNKTFFSFNNFYNNTKKTFKSNNKKSNYINQLLSPPLLKHTHARAQVPIITIIIIIIIIIIIKRQYQPSSLRNRHPYNTPDRGPNGNSLGIGVINCCRRGLHTRGCKDPRTTSFLCKCNLTKNYLTSVSLLKHFSTSC